MGVMALRARLFNALQVILSRHIVLVTRLKMWATRDAGVATKHRRELFTDVIKSGGVGCELGVYKGNLSRLILDVNKPKKLHLVDLWWLDDWSWAEGDRSQARAAATVIVDLSAELESGKVEIHVGSDLVILESFDDGYFDWIYIDTSHQYEHTKLELALSIKKAKIPHGVIAGDDWYDDESNVHYGVAKAVKEFLVDNCNWELTYQKNNQWAIQLKSGQIDNEGTELAFPDADLLSKR